MDPDYEFKETLPCGSTPHAPVEKSQKSNVIEAPAKKKITQSNDKKPKPGYDPAIIQFRMPKKVSFEIFYINWLTFYYSKWGLGNLSQ